MLMGSIPPTANLCSEAFQSKDALDPILEKTYFGQNRNVVVQLSLPHAIHNNAFALFRVIISGSCYELNLCLCHKIRGERALSTNFGFEPISRLSVGTRDGWWQLVRNGNKDGPSVSSRLSKLLLVSLIPYTRGTTYLKLAPVFAALVVVILVEVIIHILYIAMSGIAMLVRYARDKGISQGFQALVAPSASADRALSFCHCEMMVVVIVFCSRLNSRAGAFTLW